jgi:predicted alpha-1,2-mannosidase
MPGVYSDQNGAFIYSGQTSTASGYQFVTDVSGWDIYRTLAGLYDLIAPDMALNLVQSLHSMAVMGQNYAKWPLATGDAGSMIGSAADVIAAQAYLNGITGFDVQDAYKRLRDAALLADLPAGEGRGGRDDFSDYSVLDYAVTGGAVSLTCELNQDDFALSQFATALGETADAQALAARSHGYQKLYDPTTGFLRARDAQGNIVSDNFDAGNFGLAPEYVEADAWQTMFCPQFDVDGLAQVWGGRAQLVAGLSSLFDATEKEHTADLAQQANPMGLDPNLLNINLPPVYFFGGNEPDIHYPYLFAQAGRPDLTQKWVPWVMSQYYSSAPNGLPGNDDGGTMSAWFVWSAIGLYPIPGSGKYIVGTPAFQEIDMALTGGTFKIVAQNASSTNIYVQSAKLNGVALNSAIIQWSDLKPGGALELVMGPKASQWARAD